MRCRRSVSIQYTFSLGSMQLRVANSAIREGRRGKRQRLLSASIGVQRQGYSKPLQRAMVDFGAIESARSLIQNRLLPPWRLVEKTTYRSDDSTQGGKSQWKMGFILATTSKGFIDMPHTFNYTHLPPRLLPGVSSEETPAPNTVRSLAEVERKALIHALEVSNNNVSKAAQSLEINRTTLYRKLKKYGLPTKL